MKYGKWYVSTGFRRRPGGWWHLLFAVHRHWRLSYFQPVMKPKYRRVYFGPLEIEWSF